jgi:hypothetical protein
VSTLVVDAPCGLAELRRHSLTLLPGATAAYEVTTPKGDEASI